MRKMQRGRCAATIATAAIVLRSWMLISYWLVDDKVRGTSVRGHSRVISSSLNAPAQPSYDVMQ
jgi:hypothetical protein